MDNRKNLEALSKCHDIRMKKKYNDNNEESLSFADFEKEIAAIKKKGKRNYNDLIYAGNGLKLEVFNFMKFIWDSENIPRTWDLLSYFPTKIPMNSPKNNYFCHKTYI